MASKECVFCRIFSDKVDTLCETDLFFSKLDKHPVTDGHSIVIPKRHIVSIFEVKPSEWADLQIAISKTTKAINKSTKRKPDGYNFCINEGRAAGRTVDHLHLHIIPRYVGGATRIGDGVGKIIPKVKDSSSRRRTP